MTEKISKYEVVERIAEGGFGVVYKARDPYLKRTVAVKTCSFVDEESRNRFFREAQLAARFDHPNVTRVHDFGVENDEAFLVQEYLSGEDLLPKIQRRDRIPLHTKVEILLQAARGLRYAHGRGVIHRDIKPGNLRMLEGGEVKILDFGIAKPLGGSALTQQGMTVGTLGYLSPEQIEGGDLDRRTDIFSFGVVAYELIAYRSPFAGRDVNSMLRSILDDSPKRLDELVPECPKEVADVIHRCLRRNRDERYDDFEALLRDLERAGRSLDPSLVASEPAPPDDPSQRVVRKDTKPVSEREPSPPPDAPVRAAPTAPDKASATDFEATKVEAPPSPVSTAPAPSPPAPRPSRPWSPPRPLDVPSRQVLAPTSTASTSTASTSTAPASAAATAAPPGPGSSRTTQPEPPSVPARSAGKEAKRPLPVGLLAGLGLVLLLLAALVVWFLGSREPDPVVPAPTPVATTEPVTEPTPAAPEQATVLVVAGPWAEILEILDADGEPLRPNPAAGRETPTRIDLAPGFYSIVLSHPGAEEVAVCQVDATPGIPTDCRAELADIDVTGYFKETGWWD